MKSKLEKLYEMHAEFCKMFAHPIRLALIDIFREGEKTVTELQEELGLKQSTISQHLANFRKLGIVSIRKEGRKVYYKIADERILKAYDLIDQVIKERKKRELEILSL
ncbi:MAG: metalloregulator ArsR/SmtB family transcription factor [Thermoproteota archaeon]|jgi:ArsR family transcriptional regulator|nr:metalloregulator ArsR/SmtB family transcription factor [Thermoproteota archaeon]